MVRVGARLLLLVVLASWLAPAAAASYAPSAQTCCHRGAHHCNAGLEPTFRSTKVHCHNCQAVVSAQQTPRPAAISVPVATTDQHPFVHEFSSAITAQDPPEQSSQRAPPAPSRR